MNTRVTDADLLGSTALRSLTRNQKLTIALKALEYESDAVYRTIRRVEDMDLEVMKLLPVAGTVFEPIVAALNAAGVPTADTLGGVMESLEIDRDHVHEIACACHENSDHMVGIHAATYLGMIPLIGEKV